MQHESCCFFVLQTNSLISLYYIVTVDGDIGQCCYKQSTFFINYCWHILDKF